MMRSYTPPVLAALLAVLATAACLSSTAPDARVELPPGQEFRFACGNWSPESPPADRALFDLRLWEDGIETAPAPALVAAIEAAGGTVVYRFHGPMVRAHLDVRAVPGLVGPQAVNSAATVVDPDSHEVTLIVLLDHDLTADDLQAARALGGRITHEYHALGGYAVVIDDARVPDLRALPGVELSSFNAVYCLD